MVVPLDRENPNIDLFISTYIYIDIYDSPYHGDPPKYVDP